MRKLHADWIQTPEGLLHDAVLELDPEGTVVALRPFDPADEGTESLPGLICPAFVNAHCHLELSYLCGHIPQGTGMAGFIRRLMEIRGQFSREERESSARHAAEAMYGRGISAVGDICNGDSTLALKQAMPGIDWFNFVEVFGSDPSRAEEIFLGALDLAERMGPRSAVTLHAPYSISVALRDQVLDYAAARGWRQSIHLLESDQERQLFVRLDGPLLDHLRRLGLNFQGHTYHSPIDYVLERFPEEVPGLLVHVTEMTPGEIARVATRFPRTHFVLCPLANEYIHRSCPPARAFAAYPDRVCIGTDSLAGNEKLDIFAEIRHLQLETGLPTELLLRWATVNGALALGLPRERFEIALGHRPELIRLNDFHPDDPTIPSYTHITRIRHDQDR